MNVIICPWCKYSSPRETDTNFCTSCGASFIEPMVCPHCDKPITKEEIRAQTRRRIEERKAK